MKSSFLHKSVATLITISFVGTSLFAPFTAQALTQEAIKKNQTIDELFSDPKMQTDLAMIAVTCVMSVYVLPVAKSALTSGADKVAEVFADKIAKGEASIAELVDVAIGIPPAPPAIKAMAKQGLGDAVMFPVAVGTAVGTVEGAAGPATLLEGVVTTVTHATQFTPMQATLVAIGQEISGLHDRTTAGQTAAAGAATKKKTNDTITDCLVYGAGQLLLKQLTQDTVNWIKGGYHGSPSFAVDTHEIFLDLADSVAGDLARQVRGIAMCKFSANFQNDLANNIELSAKHIYKFNGATKCPFPETFNINSSDFYKGVNNFSWGAMEYAMQDNGNPFGVALLSGRELSLRSSEKADVRKQELSWSNGFTNMVDLNSCDYPDGYAIDSSGKGTYDAVNTTNLTAENSKVNALQAEVNAAETAVGRATGATYDSAAARLSTAQVKYDKALGDLNMMGENVGNSESAYVSDIDPKQVRTLQKTYCKTTTPGKIVGDALSKATGVDMDRLGAIDSINKIVGAVIEQAMQSASMGIFNAISGQDAKVQQNYITVQDKTAETIAMENYAIKNAKDALATAQKNLAEAPSGTSDEIYYALKQAVADAQKKVDAVTSVEYAIARQAELTAANAEVATALSAERSAQARADAASKAYYDALGGSLSGGTYIQPDPATLAELKAVWDEANNAFVFARGKTANARQRLYDAQHP